MPTRWRRRHAEWFVAVAAAADAQLRTVEEAQANARLESIFAELRAAYGWAARHDVDLAAELAAHLHLYAQSRFVDEPLVWARASPRPARRRPPPPPRPARLGRMARPAPRRHRRGTPPRRRAVTTAGDSPAALPALDVLTDAGLFDGHVAESAVAAATMSDLARRHGDLLYLALGHSGVALSAAYGGARQLRHRGRAERPRRADRSRRPAEDGSPTHAASSASDTIHTAPSPTSPTRSTDARAVNNRYLEGASIVSSCSLRARIGDPDEALDDLRRGGAPLATRRQHDATADDAAQPRRAPPARRRTRGTRRPARHRRPQRRPDIRRGGANGSDDARAWAITQLGTARFAELTAAGAARDITDRSQRGTPIHRHTSFATEILLAEHAATAMSHTESSTCKNASPMRAGAPIARVTPN